MRKDALDAQRKRAARIRKKLEDLAAEADFQADQLAKFERPGVPSLSGVLREWASRTRQVAPLLARMPVPPDRAMSRKLTLLREVIKNEAATGKPSYRAAAESAAAILQKPGIDEREARRANRQLAALKGILKRREKT